MCWAGLYWGSFAAWSKLRRQQRSLFVPCIISLMDMCIWAVCHDLVTFAHSQVFAVLGTNCHIMSRGRADLKVMIASEPVESNIFIDATAKSGLSVTSCDDRWSVIAEASNFQDSGPQTGSRVVVGIHSVSQGLRVLGASCGGKQGSIVAVTLAALSFLVF